MKTTHIEDELLNKAVLGKWPEVIEIYRNHPESRQAKIQISGDTAIHLAAQNGKEDVVEQLVSLTRSTLEIPNSRGNTPLHQAVSAGKANMCLWIAKQDSKLLSLRNHDGDTPLSLAVVNGQIPAFRYLLYICREQPECEQYVYSRRKNGDTILHAAISGEHFDIAYQIIDWYPKLADRVNEYGLSPLHLLASNPTAFSSGSRVKGLMKLVYPWVSVAELLKRPSDYDELSQSVTVPRLERHESSVPFSRVISRFVRSIFWQRRKIRQPADAENQQLDHSPAPDEKLNQLRRAKSSKLEGGERRRGPRKTIMARSPHAIKFIFDLLDYTFSLVMFLSGIEHILDTLDKSRQEKAKHVWSVLIVNNLLLKSKFAYNFDGMHPDFQKAKKATMTESPLVIAARNGVREIVVSILHHYPAAITSERKNIVMLAVEHRQVNLYKFLLHNATVMKSSMDQVDEDGNTVFHVAAKFRESQPWLISGAALQMHMEVKWYKFVKKTMPRNFSHRRKNIDGKTPKMIFEETHRDLLKEGREWLTNNAQPCSVVAGLIATVAFSTASNIPGGFNSDKGGYPALEKHGAFVVSSVSSLVALCFSMISVVMFLAILTSNFQIKDFYSSLVRKLLIGLITLFISINAMVVSFGAGHYFVLKDRLKHHRPWPVYVPVVVPVIVATVMALPLSIRQICATLRKDPQQITHQ